MDNLTIAVIAIAVAQALMILLSIGREREIKKLRELVNEQRLHIVKLSAWLAGRNAAQPPRIKSEREPIREPIADDMRVPEPAITPKDLHDTIRPNTTEDELKRATKAFKWFKEDADKAREIVAGLQGGAPQEPAITPKDLPDAIRPSTNEDELKRAAWSREIVAGLRAGAPPELAITRVPEPAITPKDLPHAIRPSTNEDELKRATEAIRWLKEDADKAREIGILRGTPPEKTG
jgi:hypothetical protein